MFLEKKKNKTVETEVSTTFCGKPSANQGNGPATAGETSTSLPKVETSYG